MKWNIVISILLLFFLSGCKITEDKTDNSAEQSENNEGKIKEPIENTINYDVNDDYLTDEEYPFRIENEGISSIVFHYTAQTFKKSLRSLTTGGNSSHWLVPAEGSTVYKIVNENRRARHAGTSLWKSRKNVNVISVGIEIVNLGFKCKDHKKYCTKDALDWIDFPDHQQKLIAALAKDIQKKYNIDPLCIVGHSDIAVDRKLDPGPLFPWQKLAELGVGAWVTDSEIQTEIENINREIPGEISKFIIQIRLYEFGYDIKKIRSTDKSIQKNILKFEYNTKKTKISDLSALKKANNFGKKRVDTNIFDDKKTNFAIQSFMMHYLPEDYLKIHNSDEFINNYSKHNTKNTPDNKSDQKTKNKASINFKHEKILATMQALLIKYPKKVRHNCGI